MCLNILIIRCNRHFYLDCNRPSDCGSGPKNWISLRLSTAPAIGRRWLVSWPLSWLSEHCLLDAQGVNLGMTQGNPRGGLLSLQVRLVMKSRFMCNKCDFCQYCYLLWQWCKGISRRFSVVAHALTCMFAGISMIQGRWVECSRGARHWFMSSGTCCNPIGSITGDWRECCPTWFQGRLCSKFLVCVQKIFHSL